MQPHGLLSGRCLPYRTEERDHAEAEARHGQGGPDPGERRRFEGELRSKPRHARPVASQIHTRVNRLGCFVEHGGTLNRKLE